MNAAVTAALSANLKTLKLSHIANELEVSLRQARESGLDYAEFLLQLTEHELQVRSENRQKRRIKEGRGRIVPSVLADAKWKKIIGQPEARGIGNDSEKNFWKGDLTDSAMRR